MGDVAPDSFWRELPEEEELALIARELRAYVAWQAECGTEGLPRDPNLASKLERLKKELVQQREVDQQLERAPETQQVRSNDGAASEREIIRPAAPPSAEPRVPVQASQAPRSKRGIEADAPISPAGSTTTARLFAAPQRSLEVLGTNLEELRTHVAACTKCSLHESRTQTVFSRGTGRSGLCFVGEGPGAEEDAQGAPFVGAAGQLLDQMITAMGFDREDVYVCNVVKCRPPNNRKPSEGEMNACGDYLAHQLALLKPEVIVALGGTAVEGLLGMRQGITKIRGKFRVYDGRIAVMPTFHPAYLLRNSRAKKEVWADLRQVVQYMGRQLPPKS